MNDNPYSKLFEKTDTPDTQAALTPPDDNPYASLFKRIPDPMPQANANLLGAQGTNPDEQAKVLKLSNQTGVPFPAIETDPQFYQQQADLQKNQKVLEDNPSIANWTADNPLAARLAQDEFDKLGMLSKLATALKTGAEGGLLGNKLGRLGFQKQLGIDNSEDITNTQQQLAKEPSLTGGYGTAQRFTGFITGLIDNAITGGSAGAVGGGVIGGPGGALAGGFIGFNADMATIAAGNAYLKMGQIRGSDGQQLSEAGKQFGAIFTGLATYAIGTYATALQSKLIGETAESIAQKAVTDAVTRPAFTNAVKQFGIGTAKGAGQGAAIMTTMEASGIIGEEIAKAASQGHFESNPQEMIDRLADAAVNGAILVGALHTTTAGLGLYGDFRAAARANQTAEMFRNLQDGAADSKLRDRSLEAFQSFMRSQTDGSPVENLFIPAEKIREFYQSMKVEPSEDRTQDPLFGFVKDMPEQLRQAETTGGDVVIPTSDYLAHLAGTPISEKLLPDIRVGANAMSVNEAKAFNDEYQTRIKAATEQAAEPELTGGQKISAEVREQALSAGYPDSLASRYAAIYAARYETRGERLGIDPYEAYKESGIGIQKGGGAVAEKPQERRVDAASRKRISEMTPEEMRHALLIDDLTELGNKRAYGESQKKPFQASIDIDSLKWINDNMTHGSGDKLIEAIGKAIKEEGIEGYHLSGDEFAAQFDKEENGHSALAKVRERLKNAVIEYTAPDGTVITKKGAEFSYGIDKTLEAADAKLGIDKSRREATGERAGRGQEPPGVVKGIAAGRENNQGNPSSEVREFLQEARGSIRFEDGQKIISLFEKADPSTLIHESGHAWLEELKADAARPDAPQQIKDDFKTVLKWFGKEDIGVEEHEKFARAAEAYLLEGKAPGTALASVFSRFKQWLSKIYQSVSELNTPINDEIRGVFDRLLATDSEIEEAKKTQGLEPSFKTREEAGMTAAEWKSYLGTIDKANQQAESTLLDKTMANIRRQRSAEYKEESAPIREQVTADIDKRPDIQALTLLTKGKLPDGGELKVKLSREAVEVNYGEKTLTDLPKGVTAKAPDGVHPDHVAEILGYASGKDLIDSLSNLEQQQRALRLQEGERRGIRQYLIDQAVDQRMSEKHGDILNEASIKDEAMAAIHSEKRTEMLALELRYIKRSGVQSLVEKGKGRLAKEEEKTTQANLKEATAVTREMLDNIRAHADNILSTKYVDDAVQFGKYLRDERKAAREVQQAILKKDWNAAALAKQRQLLSNILYVKSKTISEEVDSATAMMDRLSRKSKFDGVDQSFTDQIHALLERFGVRTVREPEELMRGLDGKSLSDFAAEQYTKGYDLPITQFVSSGSGDVSGMKLSNFRELADAVRSIQNAGREEQQVRIGDQVMEKRWAVAELNTALSELKQREKTDFYSPEDKGKLAAIKDKALSGLKSLNASLLKTEQIFDWFDGNDSNGPFNRLIFRPLKEAAHIENARKTEMATMFRDLKNSMPKGWSKRLNDQVDSSGLINPDTGNAFKFTRKRMLSIALNWGTEDNSTKLADGYKWDARTVQAFLDKNMTSDDWRFVQSVWGAFEKLGPEIDQLQRRVTGIGIEFVDGRMIKTPFGDIDGKYFPLVYDASKSTVAEKNAERTRDSLFENQYQRATTRNGSVISRVQGVQQPINLNLDIIPWKLGQTIHDLSFREAVMSADKLLGDKTIIKAMDDSMGPEVRKLMRPWLQHIANVSNINDQAMSYMDKFLNAARSNVVMVGIGFRISTMLKHGTTALSNSVGELGPRWMGAGLKEMFGTPEQMKRSWDMAMSMSSELRFRKDQYDKDIGGNLKSLVGESALSAVNRNLQEYGHLGVATLDMMSAVPTWIGALRKAESEGLSHEDAVYYADKMVRKAHGAQGITDTAAIQNSKSQLVKLTTMFYGFFNHIYNRQADTVRQAGIGIDKAKQGDFKGAGNDFAQVLARSIYYLVIPAMMEALWSSGGPDEDKGEGWLEWAGKAVLTEIPAGIPILRDIAKSAIEGHDYEISPLARAVKTITGTGADIASLVGLREKDASQKTLQHAMETFGYFTGTPTGQSGAAAQFLWDVGQGNQDPQSLAEWIQGLMHGKIK